MLLAANKFSQAIDLYTQAIELNSQNAVYWANRAFAHTKLEEYGSAVQDATKAIEIDPKYSKVNSSWVFLTCIHMHIQLLECLAFCISMKFISCFKFLLLLL